ncbi:MAG: RNA methyltransferase [Rhabdochlamydiaceae bacterium]|nr:RNA methyltransferase [Candidatus Amphrikana amoebophyrae]
MQRFERPFFTKLCEQFSPEKIIENLAPFLTKERIDRIDHVLKYRIDSVEVAVESPADIHNALAIVRTAEAMGVTGMHIISPQMKPRKGKRTTRGTSHWTDVSYSDSLDIFGGKLEDNISLCGAVVSDAHPLGELCLDKPVCLFFGNEHSGLTDEAKKRCDQLFTIPMYGMVESLNLSVAASIALYDVLRRKRESGTMGDFNNDNLLREKAYYFAKTLGLDQSKKILLRKEPL